MLFPNTIKQWVQLLDDECGQVFGRVQQPIHHHHANNLPKELLRPNSNHSVGLTCWLQRWSTEVTSRKALQFQEQLKTGIPSLGDMDGREILVWEVNEGSSSQMSVVEEQADKSRAVALQPKPWSTQMACRRKTSQERDLKRFLGQSTLCGLEMWLWFRTIPYTALTGWQRQAQGSTLCPQICSRSRLTDIRLVKPKRGRTNSPQTALDPSPFPS